MQAETIDSPQSANGTDAETTLADRKILQQFITINIASLKDLCYEAGKNRLFFTAPDEIIVKLFDSLHRYGGPLVEADFMKWARRFVSKEAARYVITERILVEYEDLIHKAIHESLWSAAVDCAVEHQDIYWEIVYLIFEKAHLLDRPGKAKLSTRLYALVKKHIYLYHNKPNRQRWKSVQLNKIGCEHLSEEELAAIRAAETDNTIWEPGYAEAALS